MITATCRGRTRWCHYCGTYHAGVYDWADGWVYRCDGCLRDGRFHPHTRLEDIPGPDLRDGPIVRCTMGGVERSATEGSS